VSEPNLAPVGRGEVDHPAIASAARDAGYSRWVSIEMKEPAPEEPWIPAVRASLEFVRRTYLSSQHEQILGVAHEDT
jgi:sugar phosphate isomerase/epimerase